MSGFSTYPCKATALLGGVKEINYFIAFEITYTLMQRAMIASQLYHAMSVIS